MEFEHTEEHDTFAKVVRDFAEKEIAPHAAVWDRDHTFPTHVVLAMGELGLFGLPFPEAYGGSGSDFTTTEPDGGSDAAATRTVISRGLGLPVG
jgi:short/branched chain acyl-CoA dehydrogenase